MMQQPAYKTRLYAPAAGTSFLCVDDSETMQIRKSLRLQDEDIVQCFNGDGIDYSYRIDKSDRKSIQLSLLSEKQNIASCLPQTTVLLAATKGKTKDRMVRDLTPLGVTEIIFYYAERSVAHPEVKLQDRLRKIAIESCRQCERSTIPEVLISSDSLDEWMNQLNTPQQQIVYFYERQANCGRKLQVEENQPLVLVFGPEGGFTDKEIGILQTRQAVAQSLGPRILRAELAAVVGTTVIQHERGLLV